MPSIVNRADSSPRNPSIELQGVKPKDANADSSPQTTRQTGEQPHHALLGGLKTLKNALTPEPGQLDELGARFRGRQMTVGTHTVGLGGSRTTGGSNKLFIKPEDILAEPDSDSRRQAGDLTQRVASILDTSLTRLPAINQRPQRSLVMRALLTIPGLGVLKPKTVRQLMADDSDYRPSSGRKVRFKGDVSREGHQTETAQKNLLEPLRKNIDAYTRAQDEVRQAQQSLEQATQAAASDPGTSDGPSALKEHEARLANAQSTLAQTASDLHATVSVCDSLDMSVHVMSMDLIHRKIRFVDSHIGHLRDELGKDRDDITGILNNLNELKSGLDTKRVETSALLSGARDMHDRAHEKVVELEHQLAQARAARTSPDSPHASTSTGNAMEADAQANDRTGIAALEQELDVAQQTAHDAAGILQRCQLDDDDASRHCAEFGPYFEDEIDRLGRLQKQLDDASGKLEATRGPIGDKQKATNEQLEKNRELEKQLSTFNTHALASVPPGFDLDKLASGDGMRLTDGLRRVADALPQDDVSAERWLPRAATMDMLCRGLAVASDGDPGRASQLLDQLTAHPLDHWIAPPRDKLDVKVNHAPPSLSMNALLENMAGVPRGIEVLNLAVHGSSSTPLERGQLEAAQAFWMAHNAQRQAPPEVRDWLDKAMQVAAHKVRNTRNNVLFETTNIPLKHQAAFNAVRNGFLSNAPDSDYDLSNRNLLNVTETIKDLKDPRSAPLNWLPRSLDPGKHASPFRPEALRLVQKQMEGQGMETTKTRAEASITRAFASLGDHADIWLKTLPPVDAASSAAGDSPPVSEERLLAATVVALSRFVSDQQRSPTLLSRMTSSLSAPSFAHTKRIYDAQLGTAEKAEIRRTVIGLLHPPKPRPGPRMLTKSNPDPTIKLPTEIETLFGQERVSVVDVLKTLERQLEQGSTATKTAMQPALAALQEDFLEVDSAGAPREAGIDARIRGAKMHSFDSKEDIQTFFQPMLETLRLRDQVTLTAGGVLGVGIPILPAIPKVPLSASFGLHGKRVESYLQFKSPTFASEITVGSTVSTVRDGRVSVGNRFDFGAGALSAPVGAFKLESARKKEIHTSFRGLRGKDDNGNREVQKSIDDNLALLDILLRWNTDDPSKRDETGARFSDPLEAVFALSPDTMVASGEKESHSMQGSTELRASLRGRAPGHHFSGGPSVTPLSVNMSRASERGIERTGYAHQTVYSSSDQARQRIGAGATLGINGTPYKQPVGKIDPSGQAAGHVLVPLTGNLLEVSRELASNLEKNGATRFPIGDLTGGSADRTYGTPKDLLAEVQTHREDWLLRCLDALPKPKGADIDTPERHAMAGRILAGFERELSAIGANASLRFNVKYEMQPRMSGMIDGLRGMEALARLQGDEETATQARDATNRILSNRASWSPKNMTIRSDNHIGTTKELRFVLWLGKIASAQTSRAVAAFPPT